MEVEVKFRLNNKSYTQAISAFSSAGTLIRKDSQTNTFIDTVSNHLSSKRITFRFRSVDSDGGEKCFVTVKGIHAQKLENGIMKVSESEASMEPTDFHRILGDLSLLSAFKQKYTQIGEVLEVVGEVDFHLLGSFKTNRAVFQYEDLKVEIDETEYAFGNAYEIEVENVDPVKTKERIEEVLKGNGIEFGYSKRSKFGNFRVGSIE